MAPVTSGLLLYDVSWGGQRSSWVYHGMDNDNGNNNGGSGSVASDSGFSLKSKEAYCSGGRCHYVRRASNDNDMPMDNVSSILPKSASMDVNSNHHHHHYLHPHHHNSSVSLVAMTRGNVSYLNHPHPPPVSSNLHRSLLTSRALSGKSGSLSSDDSATYSLASSFSFGASSSSSAGHYSPCSTLSSSGPRSGTLLSSIPSTTLSSSSSSSTSSSTSSRSRRKGRLGSGSAFALTPAATSAAFTLVLEAASQLWKDNPERDLFNTFAVSERDLTRAIKHLETQLGARGPPPTTPSPPTHVPVSAAALALSEVREVEEEGEECVVADAKKNFSGERDVVESRVDTPGRGDHADNKDLPFRIKFILDSYCNIFWLR